MGYGHEKIDELKDALRVFTRTPHIRAYLAVMDPKALEQAETALEVPEFQRGALKGPLPDLRDMQVLLDGVRAFLREHARVNPKVLTEADRRSAKRALALETRIAQSMVPLAEREDKINTEEDARERRKAAMADH